MEDKLILEGIGRGNPESLGEVFEKYGRYVTAVAVKVGGSNLTKQDVEEIVSDVFVQIWKTSGSVQVGEKGMKLYVGVIARNLTLNVMRKGNCRLEAAATEKKILRYSLKYDFGDPFSKRYLKGAEMEQIRSLILEEEDIPMP